MRYRVVCILLIVFGASFSVAQQKRVEEQFVDCLNLQTTAGNKTFSDRIIGYEKYLLEEGFLEDGSGADYKNVLMQMMDKILKGDLTFDLPEQSFDIYNSEGILSGAFDLEPCSLQMQQNEAYPDSKPGQLLAFIEDAKAIGDIDPETIMQRYFEIIQAVDFNLDYYKFSVFMTFDSLYGAKFNNDSGISLKLPPVEKTDDAATYTQEEILSISLATDDTLRVEGEVIAMDELAGYIKRHYQAVDKRAVFSIGNASQTSYKAYVAVQKELASGIRAMRNTYALKTYNKTLDELSREELKEVKLAYPQRISETKLKD